MLKLSILYTWRVSLSINNSMNGIFWTLRLYPSEYSYLLLGKCSEVELFAWLSFFLMKQAWSVKVCRSTCYQWAAFGEEKQLGPHHKRSSVPSEGVQPVSQNSFLSLAWSSYLFFVQQTHGMKIQNWFLFNIHYNIKVILVQCPLSL